MDFQRFKIAHLADEDKPREKLLLKGRTVLTDAELLAIQLGSGNNEQNAIELAQSILRTVDNDLGKLSRLSVADLIKFKGVGEAKAINIISALELGRRRKDKEPEKRLKITCSSDAYQQVRQHLIDLPHEEFWTICLKRNNEVITKQRISAGGMAGTVADPRIIFKRALESHAAALILVHNHPSGNLRPSQSDIDLTRKLKEGGRLLDIPVLDHLIFTDGGYYSFADEGIL